MFEVQYDKWGRQWNPIAHNRVGFNSTYVRSNVATLELAGGTTNISVSWADGNKPKITKIIGYKWG